ncbi:LysM peptidoglycan-binding domain-containing protein [Actinoplanes sp. NPDC049681]|uniref:LysM peptidoglycan-binding domain-containing protein n=1 Tax=Actinoplanes sp. NPDC049681 TaxID=3363905 RepID=UPI00379F637B
MLALAMALGGPAAAHAPSEPVKYYVVRSEYRGEPEFLYEIAERFLGDGERYREIFKLNKGRLQPDGGRVTDPGELDTGWILRLPADAKGDGVVTGPLPAVTAPSSGPAATPGGDAAVPPAGGVPTAGVAPAKVRPDSGPGLRLVLVLVAGGLLLAAAVVAAVLLRRRRRAATAEAARSAPAEAPAAATLPRAKPAVPAQRRGDRSQSSAILDRVDAAAGWTVDRALRVVATACHQAGRPLPQLYALMVTADRMALRLAVPDDRAPAPWVAADNGRTWESPLLDLQAAPVDVAVPVPSLRLVTLGSADQTRVLLDLGQCHGLIAIDAEKGEKDAVRVLALTWAAELATNSWSAGVRVIVAGLGGAPSDGDGGILFADGVRAALDEVSAGTEGAAGVLFLAAPPSGRDAAVLKALIASPESRWAVVVLGAVPEARWSFRLHADGRLDTGAVGMVVHAPVNAGPSRSR